MFQKIFDAVEKHQDMILAAEAEIKKMPELSFREWKTHAYMKKHFEELGYSLVEAGDIPGFYTDVDTGRPGPKIAVFGELDGLCCPGHPLADPETGAAHVCGHNCQCAALLGLAAALKEQGVLDELCGSIRLIAVPAEEGTDSAMREKLKNTVRYFSGKPEFLYRGYLDGVDVAMMIHTSTGTKGMMCNAGSDGNMRKKTTFVGKATHAGSTPHKGNNALYAATAALAAANSLRETFQEKDYVRMHPIITKGGNVVNAIPDEVVVENMLRAGDYRTLSRINQTINRSYAGSAAAMGCRVIFDDIGGSAPRYNDKNLKDVFYQVGCELFGADKMNFTDKWTTGCSDMGDISCVIPAVHPYVGGVAGEAHGVDYTVTDPYLACVGGAKALGGAVVLLLRDNAARTKKIVAEKKVPFASKEEFFAVKDSLKVFKEGVSYRPDGTILLDF